MTVPVWASTVVASRLARWAIYWPCMVGYLPRLGALLFLSSLYHRASRLHLLLMPTGRASRCFATPLLAPYSHLKHVCAVHPRASCATARHLICRGRHDKSLLSCRPRPFPALHVLRVTAGRMRSAIAWAEQGEADGAHVDDADEAGLADDRQVPEAPVRHDLGCLTEAGSGSHDDRLRGHHFGDPDLVDVLAVGYGVRDVGVGDDPHRPV